MVTKLPDTFLSDSQMFGVQTATPDERLSAGSESENSEPLSPADAAVVTEIELALKALREKDPSNPLLSDLESQRSAILAGGGSIGAAVAVIAKAYTDINNVDDHKHEEEIAEDVDELQATQSAKAKSYGNYSYLPASTRVALAPAVYQAAFLEYGNETAASFAAYKVIHGVKNALQKFDPQAQKTELEKTEKAIEEGTVTFKTLSVPKDDEQKTAVEQFPADPNQTPAMPGLSLKPTDPQQQTALPEGFPPGAVKEKIAAMDIKWKAPSEHAGPNGDLNLVQKQHASASRSPEKGGRDGHA